MTKATMIEYLNDNYEWFECMQKGLGHHSWWYTNRSPEECINVKLHAWVDMDKITEKLTDQEKRVIDTLGIDLTEYANDLVWSDFGIVETARESLLEELKEKHNVTHLEYGGKSGGWLAVVYSWGNVYDDYENEAYTYQEIKKYYNIIKNARAEHNEVAALVLERKKELEDTIEDPEYYIEQIQEYLSDKLQEEKNQAQRILALA